MNNKNNFSSRETAIQQGRLGSRSFAAPHTSPIEVKVGGTLKHGKLVKQ